MRNAIYVVITAVLMSVAMPVVAAGKDGKYRPYGNTSCGSYIESLHKNDWKHVVDVGWVAGYIASYNLWQPDTADILGSSDMNSVLLWLENYCKANPLSSLADGMENLIKELYPNRRRTATDAGK